MLSMTSFLALVGIGATMAAPEAAFMSARPVWLEGREQEMNVFAGFRAVVDASAGEPVTVRIAAATLYRLFVNGAFVGSGPARGPHGHYRVDEWTSLPWRSDAANVVAVEVAGYNANSYYVLDQPSFLQAEVLVGNKALAATGDPDNPFVGFAIPKRVQKTQRYSFQRPFIEVWRLAPDHNAWRVDPNTMPEGASLVVVETKALLPRGVPYPRFEVQLANHHVASGRFVKDEPGNRFRDRSLMNIGPALKGFPIGALDMVVSEIIEEAVTNELCLLYTSPSPRDRTRSRMPSSA